MKKVILLTLSLTIITAFFLGFKKKEPPVFYYAFDKKIYLEEIPGKLIVTYDALFRKSQLESFISKAAGKSKRTISGNSVIVETGSLSDKQALLQALRTDARVKSITSVYKDKYNVEMGVNNEILLKFKENIRQGTKDSILAAFNCKRSGSNAIFDKVIITAGDVLETANRLQESGLVIFSHPNFLIERKYCNYIPNDPYFDRQWYLRNTSQATNDGRQGTPGADIKVTEVWKATKGSSNITIAVLDMGVTSDHPDLPNSRQVRLPGSNYYGPDPNDPSPNNVLDYHGNASAGIIAATQDNNEGISGIAPNCKIMPINIGGLDITTVNVGVLAGAIELARANGADVIYNGWVTNSLEPNAIPAVLTAIQNATTSGRNNRGCVVVCPVNNGADNRFQNATGSGGGGGVDFPANVLVDGVLTVGASDRYDKQANYSPSGWEMGSFVHLNPYIDIVAPSHRAYPSQIPTETYEVWTIDIPGTNGVNPYPADNRFRKPPAAGEELPNTGANYQAYTGRFGGSSAAAPQVAAVAALVLSVNPNLTQLQVFDILTSTADKVGGYNYNYYTNNPYFPGRSRQMGYGRLNACKAVTQAFRSLNPVITGPNSICDQGTYSIPQLPAGTNVNWWIHPGSGVATLSVSNNQATLTRTGSGDVTLYATTGDNCDAITYKNVAVGAAPISGFNILTNFCHGGTDWEFQVQAQIAAGTPEPLQYIWSYNGADLPPSNSSTFYTYVFPPQCITIGCKVVTNCGTSQAVVGTFCSPCGLLSFQAAPNPTNGDLFVTMDEEKGNIRSAGVNEKVQMQLFEIYSLRMVKQWQFGDQQKQYRLSVSGLPKGIYLLQITKGKYRQTKKIIVN